MEKPSSFPPLCTSRLECFPFLHTKSLPFLFPPWSVRLELSFAHVPSRDFLGGNPTQTWLSRFEQLNNSQQVKWVDTEYRLYTKTISFFDHTATSKYFYLIPYVKIMAQDDCLSVGYVCDMITLRWGPCVTEQAISFSKPYLRKLTDIEYIAYHLTSV